MAPRLRISAPTFCFLVALSLPSSAQLPNTKVSDSDSFEQLIATPSGDKLAQTNLRVEANPQAPPLDLRGRLYPNIFTVEAGEWNRKVLQEALNGMRNGAGVTLPSGCIAIAGEPTEVGGIKALLHTPPVLRGGIIQGQGDSRNFKADAQDNRFGGSATALVYVGPEPTEPTALLALPSGRDFVIQNLGFYGRPFLRDNIFPFMTGLAVVKADRGVGSGHHKLQNLTFEKLGVGLQFGVAIGDGNNDVCFVQRPTFVDCLVATQMNAHMAMDNTFVSPIYEGDVDIAFQINAGGTLKVWGGFAAKHLEALLQIHNSGSNNGRFEVRSFVQHGIDGPRKTKFVDMPGDKNRPCSITFENLDCKPQYYDPAKGDVMFDIHGPTSLYLDKCYGLQRETIRLRSSGKSGTTLRPFVDVSRSTFVRGNPESVADLISADSVGKWHWKGTANRRFYTQDNTPIPDEQNY